MLFSSPLLVLECDASHVAIARFSVDEQGVRLDGIERVEFPARSRTAEWHAEMTKALREIRARGLRGRDVALVVPGQLCLAKQVRIPAVDAEKREQLIRFEAEQAFPVALSSLCWGTHVITDGGGDLDLLLCAGRHAEIAELCTAVELGGFIPTLVIPRCVAAHAGIATAAGSGERFIECEAHSTSIVCIDDTATRIRSIRFGCADVAKFVERRAGVSPEEAERLLKTERAAASAAAEWLAARIRGEIDRSLQDTVAPAASSQHAISFTATTPLQHEIGAELERQCGCAVEMPERSPTLAGAASLALESRRGRYRFNLLPAAILRERTSTTRWRHAAVCLSALALVGLILAASGFRRNRGLSADIARLQRELAEPRSIREKISGLEREVSAMDAEIALLESECDARDAWARFLADLEDRFNSSAKAHLASLEEIEGGPATKSSADRRFRCGVELDGTSATHAENAGAFSQAHASGLALLEELAGSQFVRAIDRARFDPRKGGGLILQFDLLVSRELLP